MDWEHILAYVTGMVDQELLARPLRIVGGGGKRSGSSEAGNRSPSLDGSLARRMFSARAMPSIRESPSTDES
jgi:hypothetical protein